MTKTLEKKMINVRVDIKLMDSFREHCKNNGFSISKRIRVLIKNDVNGK